MSRIITKIKKLGVCLTAVITGIAGLVSFSSCSVILRKKDPDYRVDLYHIFKITVPEEWEEIYHNSGSFDGWQLDGTAYYVFAVSEYDEEFFSEFSDIKNEEFEKHIETIKIAFDTYYHGPIDPQYLFDLDQSYEWFDVKAKDDRLIMIYQSQRLYVFGIYM